MKKLRFLLFDANVVFQLHEVGLWGTVVDKCGIILGRVVAEHEVRFFRGRDADQIIDLLPYVSNGQIEIIDATATQLSIFQSQFSDEYLEKLDPGELESLCYLVGSNDPLLICSSDAIVFRVLACLNRSEQGISLEEVLQQIGLSRTIPQQFTKDFRLQYTRIGQRDLLQGRALRSA